MKRLFIAILAFGIIAITSSSPPAIAISATPAADCSAVSSCTIAFTYTGDYYSWTVPAGVASINVDAQGAAGGPNWSVAVTAGKGGRVQATVTTTPGETLFIYVGGTGSQATPSSNAGTAGWNGGGLGGIGNGTPPNSASGTGGGGASDIRTTAGDLTSRILVAAGGGGSANNAPSAADSGGDGGGLIGSSSATAASGSTKATGGTQSVGGTGNKWGASWSASTDGSFGVGSNAATGTGGGGGGGGFYGGAGGSWTGGGGGSSWVNAIRTSGVTHTAGFKSGNGLINITYASSLPVLTLSIAGGVRVVKKGESIALTASTDQAGKVTFLANGKKIAKCIGINASVGNVTCNWKPTTQGPITLIAAIYQAGTFKSSSPALLLGAAKRTGTR
jgi:hypothetical protein